MVSSNLSYWFHRFDGNNFVANQLRSVCPLRHDLARLKDNQKPFEHGRSYLRLEAEQVTKSSVKYFSFEIIPFYVNYWILGLMA